MSDLQRISVSAIDTPVETRPYNQKHAESLVASIKAEGLHQPIKVFQCGNRYILGPGRHRLEAIKMIGWTEVDAVVEPYESDEQVRASQRAENILRENMNPIEEALAIEEAVVDNGDDEQKAADQLGKPLVYVQQRIALLSLTPEARESLVQKRITLRHAQLLAKIGNAKEQNDLLDRCEGTGYGDMAGPGHKEREEYVPPMSSDDLATFVRTRQRDLVADATWNLDTPFGSHNRDCTSCLFNSKNRPQLFVDAKKSAMTCGDGSCFDEKRTLANRRTRSVAFVLAKDGVGGIPLSKKNCKRIVHKADVAAVAEEKGSPFVTHAAVMEVLPGVIDQRAVMTGGKKAGKKPKPGHAGSSSRFTNYNSPAEQRKRAIQEKLYHAGEDWKNRLLVQAANMMAKNPLACGYLVLLNHHQLWRKAENNRIGESDRKKFVSLLAVTPKATAEDLARIARTIDLSKAPKKSRRTLIPNMLDGACGSFRTWNTNGDVLVACFTAAFKLDTQAVGEKPTFQSIEQKHFPKPKEEKKPDSKAEKMRGTKPAEQKALQKKAKAKARKARDGVGVVRRAAKQSKKKGVVRVVTL